MWKKILIGVITVLVVFVIGGGVYIYSFMNKVHKTKLPTSNADLGINPTEVNNTKGIENIAFFGLDARVKGEPSRSDTIMIMSIDKTDKKIKMCSIMRDTYVPIPGRGSNKINAAYAFGGPLLAIKTLNSNFNLDIKDYVTVDFFGMEKLINAVGGVQINVSNAEAQIANGYIDELNKLNKNTVSHISGGNQTLNGRQAVAYCRIRYVGNADFQRTERQRTVLNQVYQKIKAQGVTQLPETIATMLPYIETSLSNTDMLAIAKDAATLNVGSMDQFRIPIDGSYKSQTISGMDCLVIDMQTNKNKLHEFIYGN